MRVSRSIRLQILLLSLATIGPVILLTIYFNIQQLKRSQEIEITHLKNSAKLIAAEYLQINEGARQLLISLSSTINTSSPTTCNAYLLTLLRSYKRYANFGIIDSNGNLICSAVTTNDTINLSDRYFFIQTMKSQDFTVGEYIVSPTTKKPSLNFGYPLPNNTGVVYASLDLSWLENATSTLRNDPATVTLLFDRKGTILTRHPYASMWIGKSFNIQKNSSLGEVREEVGLDGIKRLYAYEKVTNAQHGPYVAVGIPQSVLIKGPANSFIKNILLSAAIGLASLTVGWMIGNSLITRVITATKDVESLKRDFVSLVSHQIRTPLTAIRWFTQILLAKKSGPLTKKQKEILLDTLSSVSRMTSLVNTLLTISKLESGNIPINFEKTKIRTLLLDARNELKDIFLQKKIKLVVDIHASAPTFITADSKLIKHVILNLLSNAYKYSNNKSVIKIIVSKRKKGVIFSVINNGIGILRQDYEKLWKKFSRGSNAHKKDTEGAGLGLYLSKLIVEAHNGNVGFTSSHNKTSFFFTLPVKIE